MNIKKIVRSFLLFLLITMIIYSRDTPHFAPKLNSFDILLCLITVLIFTNYKIYPRSIKFGKSILSILILSNVGLNCYIVLRDAVSERPAEKYFESKDIIDTVNHYIADDSIVRIGKDGVYSRCEPSMFGYAGITNFSSTENSNTLKLVKDLGLYQYWMMAEYESNKMMSTQNLLGINYIITERKLDSKIYDYKTCINNLNVYKNEYALPLLFKVDSLYSGEISNLFELQNYIYKSLKEDIADIYNPSTYDVFYEDTIEIIIQGQGKNEFIQYIDYLPSFEIIRNNDVLYVDENESKSCIYNLGIIPNGEIVKVKLHSNDFKLENLKVYNENTENILETCKYVKENTTFDVKKISSSNLSTTMNYNEDVLISTSIPYDECWEVYQDGKEVEVINNMNGLLSFEVESGKHRIELKYIPKGLKLGIMISLISIFLYIGLVCYKKYVKQNQMI